MPFISQLTLSSDGRLDPCNVASFIIETMAVACRSRLRPLRTTHSTQLAVLVLQGAHWKSLGRDQDEGVSAFVGPRDARSWCAHDLDNSSKVRAYISPSARMSNVDFPLCPRSSLPTHPHHAATEYRQIHHDMSKLQVTLTRPPSFLKETPSAENIA